MGQGKNEGFYVVADARRRTDGDVRAVDMFAFLQNNREKIDWVKKARRNSDDPRRADAQS